MTVAERNNAATFMQFTTVRPFCFMGSSFRCFYCQEYYSDITALLNHTSDHTIDNRTTILAKYIPKGKRTLLVDISDLKCRICGEKYVDLNTVREHLADDHGHLFEGTSNGMTEFSMKVVNDLLRCHKCEEEFYKFSLLNSHMNSHVGKVVCETCGAVFLNQYLLRKHNETHLIMEYKCKQCDRVFYKQSQLKYHSKTVHRGKERVKPLKCLYCPQTFKEYYGKIAHLKAAHGIAKTFLCHLCKSKFGKRRALTEHMTKYHTEKYKCEICSKCFATEFRLKQHMKGHTGEKSYVCQICKNAYMHKMSLNKHMHSHSAGTV